MEESIISTPSFKIMGKLFKDMSHPNSNVYSRKRENLSQPSEHIKRAINIFKSECVPVVKTFKSHSLMAGAANDNSVSSNSHNFEEEKGGQEERKGWNQLKETS